MFDGFFRIQIIFPLDSFPPVACQLPVTQELMVYRKVVKKSLSGVTESGYSCVLGSSLKFCSHVYLWPEAVPIEPNPRFHVYLSGVCWQAYTNRTQLNNI